ncbi:MAG: hypothetical protein ABSH34_05955 [Verrucomicrobiota bacterium]|jgi:hypothetical protein
MVLAPGLQVHDPHHHRPGVAATPRPPACLLTTLRVASLVRRVDFVLQQNADLGTTNWTDVPGTPALDYSTLRNQVAVPAPAGPMFYRPGSP